MSKKTKTIVIVNVNLEYEVPEHWEGTPEEYAENVGLPKEYVEDSFEFVKEILGD
jgi:hypothetical protein